MTKADHNIRAALGLTEADREQKVREREVECDMTEAMEAAREILQLLDMGASVVSLRRAQIVARALLAAAKVNAALVEALEKVAVEALEKVAEDTGSPDAIDALKLAKAKGEDK